MNKVFSSFLFSVAIFAGLCSSAFAQDEGFKTITFASSDGVEITADLYVAHKDKSAPFILLCHQAGWSRGEYREIAPSLNDLGFNCMAIDQRSGNKVNGVDNQTFKVAKDAGKETTFLDAEQDIIAALKHAGKNFSDDKLLLWGSSYSAALALRIGGEHTDLVDGVLAFAPGEYFVRMGKPKDWIASSAKKIKVPVFITSAKSERGAWSSIYDAIESDSKTKFLPATKGNHGSRALYEKFDDSAAYWAVLNKFLGQFSE